MHLAFWKNSGCLKLKLKVIACKEKFVLKTEHQNYKTLKTNKIQNEIAPFRINAAGNNLYISMGSTQNGLKARFYFWGRKIIDFADFVLKFSQQNLWFCYIGKSWEKALPFPHFIYSYVVENSKNRNKISKLCSFTLKEMIKV